MHRSLDSVFSKEPARLVFPSVALFLMTAGFILTKTGRDALYFQRDGLFDLPWAYLAIAFLSIPVATSVLSLMRVAGPRRARIIAPVTMAALQVAFFAVAEPGGGPLMTAFFTAIPLVYGVLFSVTWLQGAELMDEIPSGELPNAYGILGAASMLGGVAGAGVAKLCSSYIVPRWFILGGAAALLGSAAVMQAAQTSFPVATSHKAQPHAGMFGVMPPFADILDTLQETYVRSMLVVALLTALAGVLIEFQFYALAATKGAGGRENANFFANFYIVLNGAALLLQVSAMPALQRKVGVSGSLMVLPLSLFSGALMLVLSATGLGRTALRVAEGGLKSSIHRSNWEQAYLPLARAKRLVVKVMVDGLGPRLAEGFAATILLLWLELVVGDKDLLGLSVTWITYLIVATTLLWIHFTVQLGKDLQPARCAAIRRGQLEPNVTLPDCCRVTAALGEKKQEHDSADSLEEVELRT